MREFSYSGKCSKLPIEVALNRQELLGMNGLLAAAASKSVTIWEEALGVKSKIKLTRHLDGCSFNILPGPFPLAYWLLIQNILCKLWLTKIPVWKPGLPVVP